MIFVYTLSIPGRGLELLLPYNGKMVSFIFFQSVGECNKNESGFIVSSRVIRFLFKMLSLRVSTICSYTWFDSVSFLTIQDILGIQMNINGYLNFFYALPACPVGRYGSCFNKCRIRLFYAHGITGPWTERRNSSSIEATKLVTPSSSHSEFLYSVFCILSF